MLGSGTWDQPVMLTRNVTIMGGCGRNGSGSGAEGSPCNSTLDLSGLAGALVVAPGVALTLEGLTLVIGDMDPGAPSLAVAIGMRAVHASPGAVVYWDNVVGLLPEGFPSASVQSLLQEMLNAAVGVPPLRARARMALELQDVSDSLPDGASLLCNMVKAQCLINCTVQVCAAA